MLISDLIDKLLNIQLEYGDVEISARGYDEEWNETRYKIVCGPIIYGNLRIDKNGYKIYEFSFSMNKETKEKEF